MQKPLKIAICAVLTQETKQIIFPESNRKNLYFACLRLCGKKFHEIWPYRLEDVSIQSCKKKILNVWIVDDFWPPFVKKCCTTNFELKDFCVDSLEFKKKERKKENKT